MTDEEFKIVRHAVLELHSNAAAAARDLRQLLDQLVTIDRLITGGNSANALCSTLGGIPAMRAMAYSLLNLAADAEKIQTLAPFMADKLLSVVATVEASAAQTCKTPENLN